MSRVETPFERRERQDLESALALSTQTSLAQSARLAPLPSLHGTIDNSSYPDTGTGTHTGTTDEIASFGEVAPPVAPQPNAPTPQSEIDSFGSTRRTSSGKGKEAEQLPAPPLVGALGPGDDGDDGDGDDDEVIGDSEGEDRVRGYHCI